MRILHIFVFLLATSLSLWAQDANNLERLKVSYIGNEVIEGQHYIKVDLSPKASRYPAGNFWDDGEYEITVYAYNPDIFNTAEVITAKVEPNAFGSFLIPVEKSQIAKKYYYDAVSLEKDKVRVEYPYHDKWLSYSDRVGVEQIEFNEDTTIATLSLTGDYAFYNATPTVTLDDADGNILVSSYDRYEQNHPEVLPQKIELAVRDAEVIDENKISYIRFSNEMGEIDVVQIPYQAALMPIMQDIEVLNVKFVQKKDENGHFEIDLSGLDKHPSNINYPHIALITEEGSRLGAVSLYGLTEKIEIPYYQEKYKGKKDAFLLINGVPFACKIN